MSFTKSTQNSHFLWDFCWDWIVHAQAPIQTLAVCACMLCVLQQHRQHGPWTRWNMKDASGAHECAEAIAVRMVSTTIIVAKLNAHSKNMRAEPRRFRRDGEKNTRRCELSMVEECWMVEKSNQCTLSAAVCPCMGIGFATVLPNSYYGARSLDNLRCETNWYDHGSGALFDL